MSPRSTVLVYGASGALGSALVDFFLQKQWQVIGVDVRKNEKSQSSVVVDPKLGWDEQKTSIMSQLKAHGDLAEKSIDAILCVAGGWAGGNISDENVVKTAETMLKQSLLSSLIAGHVASHYLKPGGLVVFTGAQPALAGTAGMIGYGVAKAAVHQLTQSLAQKSSGLTDAKVVCIMPNTLDTPANRAGMPNADFTSWTPLNAVASQLFDWASKSVAVESNGGLYRVNTKQGQTTFEPTQ